MEELLEEVVRVEKILGEELDKVGSLDKIFSKKQQIKNYKRPKIDTKPEIEV